MADDEEVALYDEQGREVGRVARSRMRAQNLRHGATAVLVRDRWGRVYVHRRTTTKDVYPGLLDLAAGGVLRPGEDPHAGAVREVQEELGVHGVPLEPVGEQNYADEFSVYRAFLYTTLYTGAITWQAEEVSWGGWFTLDDLVALLTDDPQQVVPDSRELWLDRLRRWQRDRVTLGGGWDSHATLVEGRWVDRTPRRDEVEPWLLAETRLLPFVEPLLPLEVPVPMVLRTAPLTVRHALVVGEPTDGAGLSARDGRRVGRFLRTLHDLPGGVAEGAGIRLAADDAHERWVRDRALRSSVLPLVPASLREAADALLTQVSQVGDQRLCHGDLGPDHLLVRDGEVAGVIDWSDARVTDPALDLSWVLGGTNAGFATALADEYGLTDDEHRRAAAWFALSPWFDVHRAVGLGDAVARDRDLAGLTARLATWWAAR